MTIEEAKKALQQLKDEGETDDEILGGMYLMYQHDEMTLDDLRTMTELLGYEFTDEFEALSEDEKKNPENAFKNSDENEKRIKEDFAKTGPQKSDDDLPPRPNQTDERSVNMTKCEQYKILGKLLSNAAFNDNWELYDKLGDALVALRKTFTKEDWEELISHERGKAKYEHTRKTNEYYSDENKPHGAKKIGK